MDLKQLAELQSESEDLYQHTMQMYRKRDYQRQLVIALLRQAGIRDDIYDIDSVSVRDGVTIIFAHLTQTHTEPCARFHIASNGTVTRQNY